MTLAALLGILALNSAALAHWDEAAMPPSTGDPATSSPEMTADDTEMTGTALLTWTVTDAFPVLPAASMATTLIVTSPAGNSAVLSTPVRVQLVGVEQDLLPEPTSASGAVKSARAHRNLTYWEVLPRCT